MILIFLSESNSKDQKSKNLMDLVDPPLNNGKLLVSCFLLYVFEMSFTFNIRATQETFDLNIHDMNDIVLAFC